MATNGADSEIRAALDGMIEALNSGDRDRLSKFLSKAEGGIHIGTEESEWFTDDQLVEALGGGDTSGIKVVVEDWSVHSGKDRPTWAAALAHFEDESRRSPAVRLTAVLAREPDGWVVVHSHASMGVPNNEMFDDA
jgi:SnoaL-like domain